MSEILALGSIVVRAEEAWEPILLGGLIPLFGALAVFLLIRYAVRATPEGEDGEGGE